MVFFYFRIKGIEQDRTEIEGKADILLRMKNILRREVDGGVLTT